MYKQKLIHLLNKPMNETLFRPTLLHITKQNINLPVLDTIKYTNHYHYNPKLNNDEPNYEKSFIIIYSIIDNPYPHIVFYFETMELIKYDETIIDKYGDDVEYMGYISHYLFYEYIKPIEDLKNWYLASEIIHEKVKIDDMYKLLTTHLDLVYIYWQGKRFKMPMANYYDCPKQYLNYVNLFGIPKCLEKREIAGGLRHISF